MAFHDGQRSNSTAGHSGSYALVDSASEAGSTQNSRSAGRPGPPSTAPERSQQNSHASGRPGPTGASSTAFEVGPWASSGAGGLSGSFGSHDAAAAAAAAPRPTMTPTGGFCLSSRWAGLVWPWHATLRGHTPIPSACMPAVPRPHQLSTGALCTSIKPLLTSHVGACRLTYADALFFSYAACCSHAYAGWFSCACWKAG